MKSSTIEFYKYKPVDKPQFAQKFCSVPFTSLQIDIDGDVQLCDCQFHMPYTIGNIYHNSLQEIWLSDEANKVRQAVADGKFTYCSWDCSTLYTLPNKSGNTQQANPFPKNIKIDLDRSCNLSCPSCRESIIIEKNLDRIQKQTEIYNELKQWAADNPSIMFDVTPCASGELFASHSGLKFLQSLVGFEHKNLRLKLTSNGTLINRNKQLIMSLINVIADLCISIDAATPETYSVVRGGDWEELVQGLDFLKANKMYPRFNFVIQKANYKEILAFGEFAQNYNARIQFASMEDWGHWDIKWWQDNSVVKQKATELEHVLDSLHTLKARHPNQVTMSADLVKYLTKQNKLSN